MKSPFKGKAPFVYCLHSQGKMMAPFTLCSLMSQPTAPRGHSLTFSRTWSNLGWHCPLNQFPEAQIPEVYYPIFLLYKVTFLSPSVLLWPLPIPGSFGMSAMAVLGKRPAACVALFFSGFRHCHRQESFLHSHMSPFTQHPLHKHDPTPTHTVKRLILPPTWSTDHCVCDGTDAYQQVSHTEGIELRQFLLKSLFYWRFLSLTHDKPNG